MKADNEMHRLRKYALEVLQEHGREATIRVMKKSAVECRNLLRGRDVDVNPVTRAMADLSGKVEGSPIPPMARMLLASLSAGADRLRQIGR